MCRSDNMVNMLKQKSLEKLTTILIIVLLVSCLLLTACNSKINKTDGANHVKSVQQVTDNKEENDQEIEAYKDVRRIFKPEKDISKIDFRNKGDIIKTLTFNQDTIWPEASKMPEDVNPQKLMEAAMNPGLGIRDIHKSGITGKGVNVAIIDQPMYLDHPEFAGKVVAYKDIECKSESSMHGPSVTSLLVGDKIGTAPDVKIYYAAVPTWLGDSQYFAKALDWIMEENKKLPKDNKIRVVSVSSAPSGEGSPYEKNREMWDKSFTRAEKEGILVLDCTKHHGIIGPCWYDIKDTENVSMCTPGYPGMKGFRNDANRIYVPSSCRATAEEYNKGECKYAYWGRGGLSWAIPYCSGVLALGWQVRPELTSKDMVNILFKSAYIKDGCKIINPKEFIKQVKEYKVK